jgi:hypothetical protein
LITAGHLYGETPTEEYEKKYMTKWDADMFIYFVHRILYTDTIFHILNCIYNSNFNILVITFGSSTIKSIYRPLLIFPGRRRLFFGSQLSFTHTSRTCHRQKGVICVYLYTLLSTTDTTLWKRPLGSPNMLQFWNNTDY